MSINRICPMSDPDPTTEVAPFTLGKLFFVWIKIGYSSFGGGAVTQYLIQEHFIYKNHWITEAQFANIIAMCQIAPGINLLAMTILIGKRLAGWPGILVSLLGLILPSAAITIAITAFYAHFRGIAKVQNALQTMFAAIFGISIATNWRNVKPIIQGNAKRGSFVLGVTLGIIIGGALLFWFLEPPVVVLYGLGGLAGAFAYWHVAKQRRKEEQP